MTDFDKGKSKGNCILYMRVSSAVVSTNHIQAIKYCLLQ